MSQRHRLIALLCLCWIIPGLIGHDLWGSDEAYTFGVVYDLLQGGSWLHPQLAGEAFLREPPLYYFVARLSARLNENWLALQDGARLATGLFMALTFIFCSLAARELNGKGKGALAPLLLIGSAGLLVRGHEILTDIAPLAGFALGYYCLALGLRKRIWAGIGIGGSLGIIFLSQGILETVMFVLLLLLLPLICWPFRNRQYAQSMGIALLVGLPLIASWPILLELHNPGALQTWIRQDLHAVLTGQGHKLSYFINILPWYGWPIWVVSLWSLWRGRRQLRTNPALGLPLTGFLVTLLVLSIAGDARDLYALPLLIPLTLLAIPGVSQLRRGGANAWYWFGVLGTGVFIIAGWFYWSALELGYPAELHSHLQHLRPSYPAAFKMMPFLLALGYTLAWLVLIRKLPFSPERPVIVWAAGVCVIWGLLNILFLSYIDTGKSYRAMIVSLKNHLPQHYDCVSSEHLSEAQRAMLQYYAGLITYRTESPNRQRHCQILLTQGIKKYEPPHPGWHKIWEGSRPADKIERFRLYQKNL
jgi:4-amino-4-deoxy-L-arabinose transferase-like glycosyltransferase